MKPILAILGALLSWPAAAETWETTCPGKATELTFSLEGTLELRASLAKGAPKEGLAHEAALLQLRYHRKALEERWKKAGVQLTSFAQEPEVKVLTRAKGKARAAVEISPILHPDVSVSSAYIKAALKKAKLPAGEASETVRYRGSWKAMACSPEGEALPDGPVSVAPLDPFLAFWMAPTSLRKKVSWEKSSFVLSPVFHAEYADIPDPYYGWYFWRPDSSGTDKWGNELNAAETIRVGENASEAKVIVSASAPAGPLQLAHAEPATLKATAIFGIIEQNKLKWDPSKTFSKLKGDQSSWPAVEEELASFVATTDNDHGSWIAADFLLHLASFLRMDSFRWRFEPRESLLTLEGSLLRSGRPARLRFFFGPTDLLVRVKPRHWKISRLALEQDDLVIYHGHSGLGENFKPGNIEKHGGRRIRYRKDQILAVTSCYSYSYYADFPHARHLVLTGSDYGGAGAAIGLLSWFDDYYGNKKAVVSMIRPTDFLIVRSKAEASRGLATK